MILIHSTKVDCLEFIGRALMGSCLSCDEYESKRERKRAAKEALAAETLHDQRLALIAGRLSSNGSSSSACLFTQQGRKGVNQDAMLAWEEFGSKKDTTFCGVFDGHGPYGHLVARRVRDSLPSKLILHWEEMLNAREEEKDESAFDSVDMWTDIHLKSYKLMDKELRVHPSIDSFCSGTTAVTVLKQDKDIVIGNVGDSRAILGTKAADGSVRAVQLTVDLKPNLPQEAERIRQCKGRVFALHDEPEVHRVWLPHDNSPGLAMARAFGDFCLKDFGVIAVPEISYHHVSDLDQFIVLATDGVWDVLSNDEVVNIVDSAPTRTTSARSLIESAVRAWRLKYPTSKMDDCAVVCLYLDTGLSSQEQIQGGCLVDNRDYAANLPPDGGKLKLASVEVQKVSDNLIVEEADEVAASKSAEHKKTSNRRLKEYLSTDESEWSALEGVTRVNTLLTLPRFLAGDKRAGDTKKRP